MGTVVEIGKAENSNTPEKTVVVQWDTGNRTNYRVGYQSAYDLRAFDLAPIGKQCTFLLWMSKRNNHLRRSKK